MIITIWRNLWRSSEAKRSSSSFTFSTRYYKYICFGCFWHAWLSKPKVILSTSRKLLRLFACKKSTSPHKRFWRYCKNMQTSYFGYFGHAWLHTPKLIVSTCRRLRCLSACQKYTSSFSSFLRYYILKNPTIWLADSILAHNSRTRILPDMGLVVKYQQQY